MLQAIDMLYENELEISIYMLDLGFENIAYNEEKEKVYFIDVENTIIVDKRKIKDGKIIYIYLIY